MKKVNYQYILYGVVFCIMAIIVVMALSVYNSTKQEIGRQFNDQQLILANAAAVGIENFMAEIEADLLGLSQRVSDNSGKTLPQDMKYSYDILKSKISYMFYVTPDGIPVNSRGLVPNNDKLKTPTMKHVLNWAIQEFKKGVKAPLTSNILYQPDGHKQLVICVPVFFKSEEGQNLPATAKFSGVLGAVVDLATIVKLFVAPIRPGLTGYAWLLDNNGTLIHHPAHSEMLEQNIFNTNKECLKCHVDFDLEREMIIQDIAGQTTYQSPQAKGYKLLAYSPIHISNRFWVVVVATPSQEISLLVHRSFRKTLILSSTAVLIIFLAALYVVRVNKMWIITQEKAKYLEEENRLQHKIKATKDYLEQILFSAGEAIISTDSQGRITTWNRASQEMFGYSKEEMIGQTIQIIIPDEKSKAKLSRQLDRVARGDPLKEEQLYLRKDGSRFVGWCTIMAIRDDIVPEQLIGYISVIRDITDRKESEQKIKDYSEALEKKIAERTKELQESQQLLEAISANAPLEIAVLDNKGKFEYVNKFWEWITWIPWNKALEGNIAELYPQLAGNAEFSQMMRNTFEHGQSQNQIEISYKEQTGHYAGEKVNKIFWSIPFFNKDGQVTRAAFMGYNVTEIKRLERQLIQSEKLAATGKLAAGIAHEINNPIYGIQGCLENILDKKKLAPQDLKFVKLAYKETYRITDLIRRLQDFHRPSEEIMAPTNINEIIQDVLLLESSYLKQPRIKVHTEFKQDLPLVMATGDQLKQVIINLVSNAKDAMPAGGDLTITTEADNDQVLINVIDTGCGIPKENQNKVFDAFFTTKKKVKGVGLGLSVSYGIIKRHHGKIEIESEPDAGTKFTLKLPIYKTKVDEVS